MVLYSVKWEISKDLAKGKGHAKLSECSMYYSVICRTSKDAVACLDFHFREVFPAGSKFSSDDGVVTLKREIVDSRNFNATYLMMDGIKEPIVLRDLKSNSRRLCKIW